jgi:regulatory protein
MKFMPKPCERRGSFPLGFGLWHKKGVNAYPRERGPASRTARRPLRPLDEKQLNELALRYVGRFATTRGRLRAYLGRKLRERGWEGAGDADLDGLAERFAELGYIDDSAYALGKSRALAGRGYGKRRLDETLRHAGVDEAHGQAARDHAESEALSSALRFAERRRIGPFASAPPADPRERQKAIAKAIGAMVRAGHSFDLAKAVAGLAPGSIVDLDDLRERARLDPI